MSKESKQLRLEEAQSIAKDLNLAYHPYNLTKLSSVNAFHVDDNMVYFYPPNDGMPTRPIEFYYNNKLVLTNRKAFSEIENLDSILLQMVKIYSHALDKKIVIDPYYFMLELSSRLAPNYRGKAKLVATEKAIMNPKLSTFNFDRANTYFINQFLDHFIGWNFGLSVNRNEKLKEELNKLNEKVIKMKLRESAGSGFEVFGTDTEAINGIQHYYLPTELPDIKKKTKE